MSEEELLGLSDYGSETPVEVLEIPIEDPVEAEIKAGRRPKWLKVV